MKQSLLFLKNRLKHFKLQKGKLTKPQDYYCTLVKVDYNPLKFIKVSDFKLEQDYIIVLENNNLGPVVIISHSNVNNFKILEDTPTLQVLYSKIGK